MPWFRPALSLVIIILTATFANAQSKPALPKKVLLTGISSLRSLRISSVSASNGRINTGAAEIRREPQRKTNQNRTFRAKPSKPVLSGDLTVAEILTSLDQTIFRNARITLKDSWDAVTYRPPWDDSEPAEHTFIFTQGFRVTNIDGCNLMLRNDDAKMIEKSKVEESTEPLIVDVWVQLNRMSYDKGKRTHRHTRDREKVRLLGAWRTEFRYYGWFSRTIVGLTLNSAEWKGPLRWQGTNIAFTFETKEMTEKFDTAFRQAIKLCRP